MNRDLRYPIVNSAFLREVKDADTDLCDSLNQLRHYCNVRHDSMAYSSEQGIHLGRILQQLRDQLATHFALEETFGFLSAPQSYHEKFHQQAAEALSGHCWLYLSLVELSEQVDDFEYRGTLRANLTEVLSELASFLRNLEAHEMLELELMRISDSVMAKT